MRQPQGLALAVVKDVRDLVHDVIGKGIRLGKVFQRHVTGCPLAQADNSATAVAQRGRVEALQVDVGYGPGRLQVINVPEGTVCDLARQKDNRALSYSQNHLSLGGGKQAGDHWLNLAASPGGRIEIRRKII